MVVIHQRPAWAKMAIPLTLRLGTISLLITSCAVVSLMVLGPAVSSQAPARVASSGTINPDIEYTAGYRIFENGSEVIWRGVGASYLLHSNNYQAAWQLHLPQIQSMGLNTIRLAFAFPDSTPNPISGNLSADILDFNKLDWVLDFLAQHNVKAILDCHNYMDMYGDFGAQKLFADWTCVAQHYQGDAEVVAYELFNEPYTATWNSYVKCKEDVAVVYAKLTDVIRQTDPKHIVIWDAEPDFPPLSEVVQYFRPNMVFTYHRWYPINSTGLLFLTPEQLAFSSVSYAVDLRERYGVPIWFGEFGCEDWPYNASNPEWLWTEQSIWKCEEQVVGWNLWMGAASGNKPWKEYLQFFPLKISKDDLVRAPWDPPGTTFEEHTVDSHDLAIRECYQTQMWCNNDYITLSPFITIRVLVYNKLQNGTDKLVSNSLINLTEEMTIWNEEGTQTHPGDWNTVMYLVKS